MKSLSAQDGRGNPAFYVLSRVCARAREGVPAAGGIDVGRKRVRCKPFSALRACYSPLDALKKPYSARKKRTLKQV